MAISDTQFSAWLRGDRPREVLVELDFGYQSAGAPAVGTIYVSQRGYVTSPTDTPASVRYHAALARAPRIRRSIDRRTLGGAAQLTVTDLVLDNRDGRFDFLLEIVLDGYECRVYLGAPRGTAGWSRADFRLAGVAVAERVFASGESEITVKLKDKRLLLDREIIGDQVGGTGADATQFLGLYWGGYHFNVEAKLFDSATATYKVLSNYAGALAVDVRDKGGSLRDSTGGWGATSSNTTVNAATDTFTKTAHGLAVNDVIFFADPVVVGSTYTYWGPFPGMSARPYWVKTVPSADTFTLSATKGGATLDITGTTWSDTGLGVLSVIRQRFYDDLDATGKIILSSSAIGRVTVDLMTDVTYAQMPFGFLEYLVETYGNVEASEIDSAAFTDADVALDAKISVGYTNYSVPVRENLLDVLDEICSSVFGWYGATREGLITCGLVDVSGIAAASHTRTLERKNLAKGAQIAVENDIVGPGRLSVEFGTNHTIQSDGLLDGPTVTEDQRRQFASRYLNAQRSSAPSGTAYSSNKPAYHRTMVEGAPRPAAEMSTTIFGSDGALPIDNYADELVADAAPMRQFITAPCRLDFFDVELGDVVQIDYSRFGLSGVNARVIGVDLDVSAGVVTLDLIRQVSPDITTSSYH